MFFYNFCTSVKYEWVTFKIPLVENIQVKTSSRRGIGARGLATILIFLKKIYGVPFQS